MEGQETCPLCGVDVTEEEAVELLVDRGTIPGVQRSAAFVCPGCGTWLKATIIAHDMGCCGDDELGEYEHELFVELLDGAEEEEEDPDGVEC